MTVLRIGFLLGRTGRACFAVGYSCNNFNKQDHSTNYAFTQPTRRISHFEITKNIEIISSEKNNIEVNDLMLNKQVKKPLVVLLAWMLAKRNHIQKYANFYLEQGFDVVSVNCTPWQLLWPTKGTQLVADDIIRFLDKNVGYSPLLLHGFSVGGYFWGEVLVKLAQDPVKYKHIIDKIIGQIWDSAADVTEIPVGVPKAVFPNNPVMQAALQKYIVYHLRTFDKVATVHYIRSSQMFHTNFIKAPALFYVSKTDPVGTERANTRVSDSWESMGIKVTWKCFDKSPHVGHLQHHKHEYITQLYEFLDDLDLVQYPEKIKNRLSS